MPNLRCSAESCLYNNEQYCSRGEINVAGLSASTSDDTCCANYCEGHGGAKNAVGDPTPQMEVSCEAKKCTYNQNYQCQASSIDVSGYGANKAMDTCCSSFYPE